MSGFRFTRYSLLGLAALWLVPLLLILCAAIGGDACAQGPVQFYYFYDANCSSCDEVHRDVLEPLLAEYGSRVTAVELDVSQMENFEFLLTLESQYKVTSPSIPEVFIGADALIGPQPIQEQLRDRIEHYLAQGGAALPAECPECDEIHEAQRTALAAKPSATVQPYPTSGGDPPTIHVAWFNQPGCDLCQRKEHDLQYLVDQHPQVEVRRFDSHDDTALHQYLCLQANVPEDRQLIAPSVFVGESYLVGNGISGSALLELIQPYLATGAPALWEDWENGRQTAQSVLVQRFRSLGLWTVVGAGLLDGVNPCAFATMIFLISYLAVRKRQGRELLATGAAFTAGVFLAYLGIGFGLLKFLTAVPVLGRMGRWMYGLTLVLCLVLAWGSFNDYRKARQGQLEDMSLKLPERMRGWIRVLIREGSRARNYALASLALGFVVSLVELACTGQVYLPTIIFVLGLPDWRARAALALLVYNLMFVLPLVVVFLMVYYGTTSQQLTHWMNRRAAAVKLGTAVLFVLLAAWLGYSIAVL